MTHDTKRSADTRARIGVLASVADEWAERVEAWHEVTGGTEDPNEEYLVYQTLIGTWPLEPESDYSGRLERYLGKALREAKVNTNWIEQDHEWEVAVTAWATGLLSHEGFLADFVPFAERVGEVLVAVARRGELAGFELEGEWEDVLRTPQRLLAERIV